MPTPSAASDPGPLERRRVFLEQENPGNPHKDRGQIEQQADHVGGQGCQRQEHGALGDGVIDHAQQGQFAPFLGRKPFQHTPLGWFEQHERGEAEKRKSITQPGEGERRQAVTQADLDQHPRSGPEDRHEDGLQDGFEARGGRGHGWIIQCNRVDSKNGADVNF